MAQYLALIYGNEQDMVKAGQEAMEQLHKRHGVFGETHGTQLAGGNALQSSETATTIREDGKGGFAVTDGPFAESKEVLGGYYLLEAADLDEAIAIAKDIPMPFGGIEVRPIQVIE